MHSIGILTFLSRPTPIPSPCLAHIAHPAVQRRYSTYSTYSCKIAWLQLQVRPSSEPRGSRIAHRARFRPSIASSLLLLGFPRSLFVLMKCAFRRTENILCPSPLLLSRRASITQTPTPTPSLAEMKEPKRNGSQKGEPKNPIHPIHPTQSFFFNSSQAPERFQSAQSRKPTPPPRGADRIDIKPLDP